MNDGEALNIARECARDTRRIKWTAHARQRMRERGITTRQVLRCLLRGRMAEPVHRSVHGDWQCKLTVLSAGDALEVVIAIDAVSVPPDCVVITAIA